MNLFRHNLVFGLTGCLMVAQSWGQVTVPVETDFEPGEGYVVGPLIDTAQWTVSDSAVEVSDVEAYSGQQSLSFSPSSAFLTGNYANASIGAVTFLDFYMKPVAGPLLSLPLDPSVSETAFMLGVVDNAGVGQIFAVDGDGLGGGEWLSVADDIALLNGRSNDWVRTTYRINYGAKTWDFYLDDQLVAADLGFLDGTLDHLTQIRLRGGNQAHAAMDYFYVGFENPLFEDADKDGIADAYELLNSMDASQDDRYGDVDHDTLLNLEEYLSTLAAGNADSDGDGVHDGMDEYPAIHGNYPLNSVPFHEGFEGLVAGPLGGSGFWQSSDSGAVVQGDIVFGGAQALALTSGETALKVSNAFNGSAGSTIWLNFQLKPVWWAADYTPDAANLKRDATAVFFFQKDGKLVTFDGNGDGTGTWLTHDLGVEQSEWLAVTLFEDYANQTWRLYIDDVEVASDQGFAQTQPYFHRFALTQNNSKAAYLDDFDVSYTDRRPIDNDLDGLFNYEEDINGNGVVDYGENDPNNADTDGDGIADRPDLLMRLWLRADTGVSTDSEGRVTTWGDTRGSGDAAQIAVSQQPTLIADAMNGQPAVRFDGVDDYLSGLSDFDPSLGDFTMIVVHQRDGGHEKAAPLSYNVGAATGAPLMRWGPETGQLGINDVAVGPAGVYVELGADSLSKPYVATIYRQGDELCVRAMGPGQTERTLGTQTWTSGGDGNFYLGRKKDAEDHFFGGDIMEVRVYTGTLTEAELLTVEAELAERYGIAIDLDDDGLLDNFERLHFGDLSQSGGDDSDSDGISNLREQYLSLDPNVSDAPAGILGHSDLKLWLRADTGLLAENDGQVSAWSDLSGSSEVALQLDPDKQPSVVTSTANGQPAVQFDGIDDYLEALTDFNASASDFTMIVVHNRTGGHDKAAVLSYNTDAAATGAPLLRWGPELGQFGINHVGVSADGVYLDPGENHSGQTYVATVTRSGGVNGLNGQLTLRQNGNGSSLESTGTQTWSSSDTDSFFIARKKFAENHYFGGEIAEILIFDSVLTPAEIAALEADLIAHYAVDADFDGDGLSDAWELQHFGNLIQDGSSDSDGDGVSDGREYNLGTDPTANDEGFHFVMARDDLQLWLSAHTGIELDANGAVERWNDLSGLNHDAIQSTAAARPAWLASNAQHAPAVVFDGVDDFLGGAAGFDPAASDYTLVLVHNRTGGHEKAAAISFSTESSDLGAPLLRWGPGAGQFGVNAVGTSATGVYVDLSTSADQSQHYISSLRSSGDQLSLSMTGTGEQFVATGSRTWAVNTSSAFTLGKKNTGSGHFLGGEIAEVLVFNAALNDADLAALEAYLVSKYALLEDIDGDGLLNSEEDINGNGMVDAGESDPWKSDSDGDGILDPLDYAWTADSNKAADFANLTDAGGTYSWSTSFEASEGFTADRLGGQQSWQASRIVSVDTSDASDGTESIVLPATTFEGVVTAERLIDGSGHDQVWISFDAQLATGRLPLANELNNQSAVIFGLTGNRKVAAFDVTTGAWRYSVATLAPSAWARYDLFLDYSSQTWKLLVNGELLFNDLAFIDPTRSTLQRFKAWQQGSDGNSGRIDHLVVSTAEPAGFDFDNDGLDNATERSLGSDLYSVDSDGDTMPDAWEYANGLDLTDPADAAYNPDGDILNNAAEYLLGTDINDTDSDDDGVDDGYQLSGWLQREFWMEHSGYIKAFGVEDSGYPQPATQHEWVDSLAFVNTGYATYASRVRGFLVPDETRAYTFKLTGNTSVELWLSTSSISGERQRIIENGSTLSLPINLVAGQKYYFELIQGEPNEGSDLFTLRWDDGAGNFNAISAASILSWAPDALDADDDGLPDTWELTQGLNPALTSSDSQLEGAYGDLDGDGYLNFEEYLSGSDATEADSDADTYHDWSEAYLLGGDPALAETLPYSADVAPWQVAAINADLPARAYLDEAEPNRLHLAASGLGVSMDGDSGAFTYQLVQGDFDLIVEVEDFAPGLGNAPRLALMVRSSMDSTATFAAVDTPGTRRWHGFQSRSATAGYDGSVEFQYGGTQINNPQTHLRLVREGDLIVAYGSQDGQTWQLVATRTVDLGANVLAGVFAYSSTNRLYVPASIRVVQWLTDADRDNISDADEANYGTSPLLADTDGDGVSDFDEIYAFYSDPLVDDLADAQVAVSASGATGLEDLGDWSIVDDSIYVSSVRGAVKFNITLAEDAIYRVVLDAQSRYNSTGVNTYSIKVDVDDVYIGRISLAPTVDQSDIGNILTPWLSAGEHTVRFYVDNALTHRAFQINGFDLEYIGGVDANINNVPDWMEARLDANNGIETTVTSSPVSPLCLEGRSRYRALSALADGTELLPLPDYGWYTNIALNPAQAVTVEVEFENSAVIESADFTWTATDVLTAGDMTLRVGDTLLLTALDLNDPADQVIQITVGADDPVASTESTPVQHIFDTAGTYTVQALVGSLTDSFTVTVVDGDLGEGFNLLAKRDFDWIPPLIGASSILQSDGQLGVDEIQGSDPRGFTLRTQDSETRYLASRISEDGAVLDHVAVQGFQLYNNTETHISIIDTYEDGDVLVSMGLVLDNIPEDIEVSVRIFVSGVTFSDGSIEKLLTAADFDELGRATLYFIKPAETKTSVCHRISISFAD